MRLDRTRERLERWAAWLEGRGQVHSARLDGMPRSATGGGKALTSFREQIETHEIVKSLAVEYQLALGRFYIEAPRLHKKSLQQIADWLEMSKTSVYRYIDEAETKFNEAVENRREVEIAKKKLKKRA